MGTFYIRSTTRQPGYQVTADNWNELNGDLNEINRRLVFQIPAESWKPRSGGVIVEPDGDSEDYRATYPNMATGIATYKLHIPQDFTATQPSPLELFVAWHADDSNVTGNVRWAAVLEVVQVGDTLKMPRVSAAALATGNTVDGEDLTVTPITIPAATILALAAFPNVVPIRAGDMVRIRIERRGADTLDTLGGPAYMLNVFGRLQASGNTQIP